MPQTLQYYTGYKQTKPFVFSKRSQAKTTDRIPPFTDWLPTVTPSYTWDWQHLVYIRKYLDKVTAGEIDRLMLFMPPRHGKSEMTTVRYPVWRLKRNPTMRIIVGAYNQTLANKFSRKARKIAQGELLPSRERAAAEDWETEQGGGLRAVGVGGGITGQGGDLIIIDDPVKNREEANSQTYRDKVWDWYTDDLYTRLEPGGAMILIMCMTGDTPVLMADGTERPLCEIRAGDRVATYDNGRLATSTVLKHKSNGLDTVFEIKTTCGKIVYANARHPFLVKEHGQLKWIRLKNLTTGQKIVTAKDNGGNGRERPVSLMAVIGQSVREGIARRITAKRCGQTGIGHRQSTHSQDETLVSSIGMGSLVRNMMQCLRHKTEGAQSASSLQGITFDRIGAGSCALTIVMKPIPSEGFYATTATLQSDMPRQKKRQLLLPSISDFTTATIESIKPAGIKEVFDIQIDRTENFIANGLVSHNTRWHEDDLAGRILASEDAPNWEVVNLPALAEENDPLGRPLGAALCPERYDEEKLQSIATVLGSWSFAALYQQRPAPAEGGMFKRAWFSIVDALPAADMTWVRWWDKAGTAKDGDYSAGVLMAADGKGTYYVADVQRGQWSSDERNRIMLQTAALDAQRTDSACVTWTEQEPGSSGKESAEATIKLLAGYAVRAETSTGSKEVRAQPFAAQCEAGNVKLLQGPWNAAYLSEITSFPFGTNDDQVDCSSGAFNKIASPPWLLW